MGALKARLRDKIRPASDRDIWIGPSPSRDEIIERLDGDDECRKLLLEWSMVELVEHFFKDERMQMAYMGQGVIGTNASPYDPGTAYVHFHHASGRLDGLAGTWGYVKGGMGMVSFLLCDAAREAGAVIATGLPVARVLPGEGVELEGGEKFFARRIICNADPKVALKLLGASADARWKARVDSVPIEGCTVKVNIALKELPNFKTRPGTNEPHHLAQVNTPLTKKEWKECFALSKAGKLPPKFWTELYFHTAYDKTVAPPGIHTMSVFAQYVPYRFAEGTWDTRRNEVYQTVIKTLSEHCSNFPGAILHHDLMGPPDIEKKLGLTGGHIFQGDIRPQYMWDGRLSARTPMKGFYLCGAATHPGGSVIAINGRNAAAEVLKDEGRTL
jgi:phytoene dehydrogenase-like protein